ncbi:hypothetical protein M441DRAFT_70877 [Trichoderma asperellum CBS 433.97]|uniref:NWD NACHT-NTPase N-terminal domain-containing protein n=1 Tax=Trichoderma asperellum (strain ATCC 204424 / CBS 433.97 / NBRC 101777) TaxID=1042311 RepID=A0A2T3Z126_TRIA4|nr:hypothetical protein M441DRAFT_70877 [Trichoderma asperellum CBS 433.97]PTB38502.1 hypothetical protein M441DRAFT_70877 [Trichoderma asperellum CBS 433.97]
MTKSTDADTGRLRKLVGRLLHHNSHSHTPNPDDSDTGSGVATPEWLGTYRVPSASSLSAPKGYGRHTQISLELWTAAYNSIRNSLRSSGLVTVYESILCQELPHQSIGGINQTLPRADDDRLKQLIRITESGLRKCRGSNCPVDNYARILVKMSKKIIKSVWADYPSTAVAWSGITILTPLLLGPTMQIEDMKRGAVHVIGRIPWYMHLSELLLASGWKSDADFNREQDGVRERLLKLYRKVLEFEMNCVCAAASTWNNAAKNVVGWHALGSLVRDIETLDDEIAALINNYIARGVAESILRYNSDLKLDQVECQGSARDGSVGSIGSIGSVGTTGTTETAETMESIGAQSSEPDSHQPFQLDASSTAETIPEPDGVERLMNKPSTVRV